MPIGASTTYPILEDVMNLARSLVNDSWPGATGTAGEGQIFVDNSTLAPFTIPFINSAIRDVYRAMGNSGVATLIQDNIILANLGPVNGPMGLAAPDPSIQVSVTYTGYNDGSGVLNTGIQLPANTLAVLKLWERQHSSGNPFVEMNQSQFGLPSRFQVSTLNDWEYRQDGIYMVGSILATDIRMRTSIALPGNVSGTGFDFASLSVPILDSIDALAWKLVEKYSFRLEPENFPTAKAAADEEVAKLIARQVRQKQSVPYHRQGYGADGDTGTPLVITGQG